MTISGQGTTQVIAGNVADLAEVGAACAWAWQVIEQWPPPAAGSPESAERVRVIARLRVAAGQVRGLSWSRDEPAKVGSVADAEGEILDRLARAERMARAWHEFLDVPQPVRDAFAAGAAIIRWARTGEHPGLPGAAGALADERMQAGAGGWGPDPGRPRVVQFEDAEQALTIRCHRRDRDEAKRLCTRMVVIEQPGERGFAATAAMQNELRALGWRIVTTGTARSSGHEWTCAQHADSGRE